MPLKNRRVDPRTPDTVEWSEQITDGKTVAEFAELPARYGIRTTQIFNPDAVSCEIADDEYSTFSPLTRIYSGNPSASEYYADGGSGYILLHASNVGKYARVLIYPGGSVLTAEVLNSEEFKGPTGATGPQGPQGPTGPAGGVTTIFGRSGTVAAQTGDYNLDQISDGTTNKAFTATEKTKLAGIGSGANVSSVFGRTGAVTAQAGDYSAHYAAIVDRAEWMADTLAGFGSTDTKIPYFTNVNINSDTAGAMTVVNNSTNGCKITINTAGRYTVGFWMYLSQANYIGISVNSNQLTTNITSITAAHRRALDTSAGADYMAFVSFTGWLAVNDVIRPHTAGAGSNSSALNGFSICRIG